MAVIYSARSVPERLKNAAALCAAGCYARPATTEVHLAGVPTPSCATCAAEWAALAQDWEVR